MMEGMAGSGVLQDLTPERPGSYLRPSFEVESRSFLKGISGIRPTDQVG